MANRTVSRCINACAMVALAAFTGAVAHAQTPPPAAPAAAPPEAAQADLTSVAALGWLDGCWAGTVNQRDFREHWSPLRGGLPSGHAALAFGGWVAITFIAGGTAFALPISLIALLMAVLTAQSRVEAGIHTQLEVVLGALLGSGMTLVVFQLWYPI